MKNLSNNYLKISQAAKALGVSPDTLRRWEKEGKITPQKTQGGTRLYPGFLKIGAAAKTLGVSIDTLRRWEKKGKIKSIRTSGGTRLYPPDMLVKEQPVSSTEELLQKLEDGKLTTFRQEAASEISVKTPQIEAKEKIYARIYARIYALIPLLVTTLIITAVAGVVIFSFKSPTPKSGLAKNVLGALSSQSFLEINSDTQINGALAVRDTINNLKLEATPSASTMEFASGDTILTITDSSTIDQDLSISSSPSFDTLNLSASKNQLTVGSGTLTWTPTATRTITLPDLTGEVSLLGQKIGNSELENSKVTVSAGTNLTGGGDVSLGGSVTLNLTSSPAISGVLQLADGTAAAPSLTFTNDTDTGLYRIGSNSIGLITGGSATSGITINGSGNVGIGTISPSTALHVVGAGTLTGNLTVDTSTLVVDSSVDRVGIGASVTPSSKLGVVGNVGIGKSFGFAAAPRDGLAVEGNVGIGTSTPRGQLEVIGNALFLQGLVGIGTTAPVGALSVSGNVGIGGTSAGVAYNFETWGTGRFTGTLTVGGNLGIGTSLTVDSAASLTSLNVSGISSLTGNVGIGASALINGLNTSLGGLRVNGFSDLTGNVGIGGSVTVSSLATFLSPVHVGDGSGTAPGLSFNLDPDTGIFRPSANALGFATAGSSKLTLTEAGSLGLGLTSPSQIFQVNSGGNSTVITSSGNVGIGTTSPAQALHIIGTTQTRGHILTDVNNLYDIGSAALTFKTIYANEVNSTTLVGTISAGNVSAETLTINSDNTTDDTQDSNLRFHRGTASPHALLTWDSTTDEFDLNSQLHITGTITGTNGVMLDGVTNDLITPGNETLALIPGGTGNVGINTTSPYAKLQVRGAGTGTGLTFLTTDSTGAQRLTVLDNGNVGIGVTNPSASLTVHGNVGVGFTNVVIPSNGLAVSGNVGLGTTTPRGRLEVIGNALFLSGLVGIGTTAPGNTLAVNGGLNLGTYASSTGPSNGLAVSGNVGIGTTTPDYPLHVIGNVGIGASATITGLTFSSGGLRVNGFSDLTGNVGIGGSLTANSLSTFLSSILGSDGSATAPGYAFNLDTDTGIFRPGTNALGLSTAGLSRITITAAGLVGIGITSPAATFQVNSGANSTVITSTGNIGIGITTANSALSVSGGAHIGSLRQGFAAPTDGLFVDGNVGIGATSSAYNFETWGTGRITGALTVGGNLGIGTSLTVDSAAALTSLNVSGISSLTGNVGIGASALINGLTTSLGGIRVNGFSDLTGNVGIGGSLTANSLSTFLSSILGSDGSATAPGYAFNLDTDTGIFRPGTNALGLSTAGLSRITITAAGLVGIGITSPAATFQVNSGASSTVITSTGNVGVGTTSPLGALHVIGQCVTGDTKLKRRKKKGKKGEKDDWEEIPIKDIKEGDEILTLDEHSGKFIPSKVNKLMDMGLQQTYLLVTETGKQIRTTANHPYFVKEVGRIKKAPVSESSFDGLRQDWVDNATPSINHNITYQELNVKLENGAVDPRGVEPLQATLRESLPYPAGPEDTSLNIAWNQREDKDTKKDRGAQRVGLGVVTLIPLNQIRNARDLTNEEYHKLEDLSSAKWLKVYDLKPGMEIATTAGWEKVIAIKEYAREQVWDIEVENTHNFVGNDIVAHNTYITGNIGIGATSSAYNFETWGTGRITGALTVGGNLGIGTSLTVDSAAALTSLNVSGISSLAGNVGIGSSALINGLTTSLGGLRVNGFSDLTGNVGVGTSLTVANNIYGLAGIRIAGFADLAGNVGIGGSLTANSLSTFLSSILGSDGSATAPGYAFNLDTDTGIFRPGTNALGLSTAGLSRITITAAGLVGIGITSPAAQFQVNSGSSSTVITSTGNIGIGITTANNALSVTGAINIGNALGITAPTNGALISGNVGIGGTSAGYNLDIWGDARVTGTLSMGSVGTVSSTGVFLAADGSASAPSYSFTGDTDTGLFHTTNLLRLTSGGTEKIRIGPNTIDILDSAVSGGANLINITPANHTAVTAENSIFTNSGQTLTITGGYANQRFYQFNRSNISAASALIVTNAATVAITGPTNAASSALITNSYGLLIEGVGGLSSNITNTYGLSVAASGGATNNYAAVFTGGNVGIGTSTPTATLSIAGNVGIGFTNVTIPSSGLAVKGNVGIGTTTANSTLSISGNAHIGSLRQGIAAPTDGLFVDGNVGIGATTSNNLLDVWGATSITGNLTLGGVSLVSDGTASTPSYSFSGDTNTGIFRPSTDALGLATGGSSRLTVTAAGLVGIGITSPAAQFQVNSGASSTVITSTGNVGVGTTSPLGALHVIGQCVVGNTKLRRRKRNKKGELTDEYEDVEIKDIKEGDEILTLDEKTGKFVQQKVEKLMNMGKQEVFELVTESGKSIQTTKNHPYLVDLSDTDIDTNFIYHDTFEYSETIGKKFYEQVLEGEKVKVLALDEEIEFTHSGWEHLYGTYRSKFDMMARFFALPKALFVLTNSPKLSDKRVKVVNGNTIQFFAVQGIVEGVWVKVIIRSINKGPKHFYSVVWKGEEYRNEVKNAIKKGAVSRLYPRLQESENLSFSTFNWNKYNTFVNKLSLSPLVIPQLFNKLTLPENRENVKWVKVQNLVVGQRIATIDGWEKIVSIKSQGKKQTYDIEVENTHNFVGNDIVAHNTYITGNIGIGATSSAYNFETWGTGRITGALTVGGNLGIGTSLTVDSASALTSLNVSGISSLAGNVGIGASALINGLTTSLGGIRVNGFSDLTGNVGIGGSLTANSLSTFLSSILGSDGSSTAPGYAFNLDTDTGIFRPGTNALGLATAGSSRLTVTAAGLVGIGITSPAATFQVNSGASSTVITSTGNVGIGITTANNALSVAGAVNIGSNLGITAPANGALISGNVGIGGTSAGYNLDVWGDARITGTLSIGTVGNVSSTGVFLAADGSASAPSYSFTGDTDTGIFHSANLVRLTAGGAEAIRVDQANLDFYQTAPNNGTYYVQFTPANLTGVTGQKQFTLYNSASLTITGNYDSQVFHQFNQPSITAATPFTATTAVTFQIAGAPTVSSSGIITNTYGLQVGRATTIAGATSTTYGAIDIPAHTVTTNTTTQITSSPAAAGLRIGQITVAQSGGAVIVDNAASLYIAAAPTAGASVTLTNPYALWVDAGATRLDGNLEIQGNLGIGTSVPNAKLSIQGNLGIGYTGINQVIPSNGLAVSGNVGIGITTANSALSVAGGAHIGSLRQGIAAPTDGLFVDGNVGIGATTSTNPFDVWGATSITGNLTLGGVSLISDGTASAPSYSFSGDTNTGIFRPSTDALGLATGGSSRLTVTAAGFVGIGITSPSQTFQINTAADAFVVTSGGNVGVGTSTPTQDLEVIGTARLRGAVGNTGLVVASNGNVGIATTAPAAALQINGLGFAPPSSPTYIVGLENGASGAGDGVNGVFVQGRYLYSVKANNTGDCNSSTRTGCEFQIYDFSNPLSPTYMGGVDIGKAATDLFVSGRYAYVGRGGTAGACDSSTSTGCEILIYDISDPTSPVFAGGIALSNSAFPSADHSIYVTGRYLYVGIDDQGQLGTCTVAGSDFGCSFSIWDISNIANPFFVGGASVKGTGAGNSVESVKVQGRYLYANKNSDAGTCSSSDSDGCELVIYDISNPAAPVYKGGVDNGSFDPFNIAVSGRYAYMNTYSDVRVFDISNPVSPSLAATISISQNYSLTLAGRYLYIGQNSGSLLVYDVGNPTSPVQVSSTTIGGSSYLGLAVAGRYAIVSIFGNTGTCSSTTATGCEIQIYDLGGFEGGSVVANALEAGSVQIRENASIVNNLTIGGGINLGSGGLLSQGTVGIGVSSGITALRVEQFGFAGVGSTAPVAIFNGGNVGIGSTNSNVFPNLSSMLWVGGNVGIGWTGTGTGTPAIPTLGLSIFGNVGIGTTTATAALDVGSTIVRFRPNYAAPTLSNEGDFAIGSVGTTATDGRVWVRSQATTFRFQSDANTADYSEFFFQGFEGAESGDVMVIDDILPSEATDTGRVKKAGTPYDSKLLGVVTIHGKGTGYNNPDDTRQNDPKFAEVGLLGHVYTKVSGEAGPIEAGDFLTSSSIPGVAMKATRPGPTIGKALEGYSGQGTGKILVFVNVSWADPNNFFASLSFDDSGSLIVPKLKAGSILLDPSLATASAQLTANGQQLALNTDPAYQNPGPILSNNTNSFDLAGKIGSLEERVKSLETRVNATTDYGLPSTATASATPSASLAEDLQLTPPDILLATGSATLASLEVTSEATVSGKLLAYDLNISNSLKSLGESILGKTLIAGDLTVDGMLTITGDSLSNLSTLYLQNSPLAEGLDIFNGKVTINKEGNITTQGKITASEIQTSKLTISNPPIASSSGALAASIGSAAINANTSKVTVETGLVTNSSKIFITPITATDKVLSVTNIKSGESFDVSASGPPAADEIKFNWWIIQTN